VAPEAYVPEQLTIKIDEAARLLGVSSATLRQAIRRGELPLVKLGRLHFVPRVAVDELARGKKSPSRKSSR
jgi:excisionase family DNA binding protein